MQAGKLRHRIDIQRPAGGEDTYGAPDEAWDLFLTAHASVEPRSGLERTEDQAVAAEVTHVVRIRYREGVTPDMRVKFGDRVLEIESVVDVDERGRELVLLCKETI